MILSYHRCSHPLCPRSSIFAFFLEIYRPGVGKTLENRSVSPKVSPISSLERYRLESSRLLAHPSCSCTCKWGPAWGSCPCSRAWAEGVGGRRPGGTLITGGGWTGRGCGAAFFQKKTYALNLQSQMVSIGLVFSGLVSVSVSTGLNPVIALLCPAAISIRNINAFNIDQPGRTILAVSCLEMSLL